MTIKVLHVVKTSNGARWAALQARVLSQLGVEVHVVLPSNSGEAVPYWERAHARIHTADFGLPTDRPHEFASRAKAIRNLVDSVQPSIIHSHFVTTTLMLRLALGRNHDIPRVFQVPGPLHMEHVLYRFGETLLAGRRDYWIASSQHTKRLYESHGVASEKVFLSYYGFDLANLAVDRQINLRARYDLPATVRLVGNINYMYPPKRFLGQKLGLKRHEDVIDALALVLAQQEDVVGVLIGGQWGAGTHYEKALRERARAKAGSRIVFTGRMSPPEALKMWHDFDCAVHVPDSENCGGVVEPLAAQVPTIASNVGGLPEVVLDGVTGWIVPVGKPEILAQQITRVLANPNESKSRARKGQQLVRHMFDVNRTGAEVAQIYSYILGLLPNRPCQFDSREYAARIMT